MYSKTILVGNAGKDAEIRTTTGGKARATFSLATSEKFRDQNGEMKEKTSWHSIVCWGGLAETAAEYVHKGKQLMVEGQISYSQYPDKDGKIQHKTEIVADKLLFLSGAPKQH